jgi:hypothetical protein
VDPNSVEILFEKADDYIEKRKIHDH